MAVDEGNGRGTATAGQAAPGRRNRRSDATIGRILAATEAIVLSGGAERISIIDVCELAGVSRGTFYRYFSSQDDLLDAFSRHKREGFHRSMLEATEPHTDPDERFRALVHYLEAYAAHGQARRLLLAAPEYALRFFRRIFNDSRLRLQDVLKPVFDAWDTQLGIRIDRELVCELLIRYVLSEQLVPHDRVSEGSGRIEGLVRALIGLPAVDAASCAMPAVRPRTGRGR
jgi:AcrR family transcriptional regulator